MGSMFGGGKKATVGYRYYMSVFMGLCRGPIDEIVEIKVGDRTAWPKAKGTKWKDEPIKDTRNTEIRAGKLFGGDKREGGIEGRLHVYMGKDNQTLASKWRSLLGGRVPGFRGVVTVWYDGLIASLNPYPKAWKFRVRRTVFGWNGAVWQKKYAAIWMLNREIKAMNAAHILYEAATNYDWGRNLKRSQLDDKSWSDSAKRLHREKIGLCLAYRRDGDLDEFVSNILQYAGGTIYTDRETGLICFKLIRNDYDRSTLPLYDYNSGLLTIEEEDAVVPLEAVNEVILKYRHAVTNQDREVRVQNLAGIQQNGRKPVTLDMPGISHFSLASRIAQRELRALSVPERYKIRMDHRAWKEYPGSVFRVSAPDRGLLDVIIRAVRITYESVEGSDEIVIEGMLDVFGLPDSSFVVDNGEDWETPGVDPATIVNYIVREMTYRDFVVFTDRYTVRNLEVTDTGLATFAVRPINMAMSYNLLTRGGPTEYTGNNAAGFVASGQLYQAISAYETDIEIVATIDGDSYEVDMLIQIDSEMMRVNAFTYDEDTLTATLNLSRGVVDTIPAPHATGARFFVVSDIGSDSKDWVQGDVVDLKMQTVTSSAVMDEDDVPVQTLTMNARQNKPYPPGNVRINNMPIFDNVTATNEPALSLIGHTSFTLTWNHRDRKSQQDVIVAHEEGDVGPEAGTQYRFQLTDVNGTVLATQMISGKTYTRSIAGLASGTYYIKLQSDRDSFRSGQVYSRKFVK